MSAFGGKAEITRTSRFCPLFTQSGHQLKNGKSSGLLGGRGSTARGSFSYPAVASVLLIIAFSQAWILADPAAQHLSPPQRRPLRLKHGLTSAWQLGEVLTNK